MQLFFKTLLLFLLHIPVEAGSCGGEKEEGALLTRRALRCSPSAISLAGVYRTLILMNPGRFFRPLPHQPLSILSVCSGRVSKFLLRLDSSSFIRQLVVAPEFFCYTLPLHSFIPFFLLFTYYINGIRKNVQHKLYQSLGTSQNFQYIYLS